MKMYNNNPEIIRFYIKNEQITGNRNVINPAKAYDLEKQMKSSKNINNTVWTEIN